jgi:hypothetical protein
MSDVKASVKQVKEQLQLQLDALTSLEKDLDSQVSGAAPAADGGALADLQGKLDAAKTAADAQAKEIQSLRDIIQVEVDDKKKDTKRLEAALAPIEQAPPVVIPEVPSASASPAQPPVDGAANGADGSKPMGSERDSASGDNKGLGSQNDALGGPAPADVLPQASPENKGDELPGAVPVTNPAQ